MPDAEAAEKKAEKSADREPYPAARETAEGEMTLAKAAKLSQVPAKQIFDFKDHGGRLVVVTEAGRKITVKT